MLLKAKPPSKQKPDRSFQSDPRSFDVRPTSSPRRAPRTEPPRRSPRLSGRGSWGGGRLPIQPPGGGRRSSRRLRVGKVGWFFPFRDPLSYRTDPVRCLLDPTFLACPSVSVLTVDLRFGTQTDPIGFRKEPRTTKIGPRIPVRAAGSRWSDALVLLVPSLGFQQPLLF